ncbi:MAG TPA: hypothetical protein VKX41_01070 [Alloacidobacterium sp.]|nr:hypothetical protein [Alloacidobacterium sp.]
MLAARKIHTHQSSKQELDELRAVVRRDLADAALPALSEDRRFATAYNAALQVARMATACAGYRVAAVPGHHALSFECAGIALGKQADKLVLFFDGCRRKRNVIDYTGVQIATATEASELLQRAEEFSVLVERWIKSTHPHLS